MSENQDKITWRRAGTHLEVKYEFIQKGTAGSSAYTFFMPGKDPRTLMQKFIDWFGWMFLGGPKIVYVEQSGKVRWIYESKKRK